LESTRIEAVWPLQHNYSRGP